LAYRLVASFSALFSDPTVNVLLLRSWTYAET
jgi:hypothetical protein